MPKVDPIIRTKLHQPYTRPGLVSRPRLQEQIALGLCGPLTLVTAPAGFGKTSLVTKCIAECGCPAAWLSLDREDNQPRRFLAYLIAALQMADERIGLHAGQLLAESQEVSPETVLTSLTNDLAAVDSDIILVLDDYQYIHSPEVNSALAFLLTHGPHTLHMLIASRSDPALPLARLRAHDQLTELRAADLRFTPSEAGQFLNDLMGLHLDQEAIRVLEERTEGWIAGLQMAALSIRDRKDIKSFIEGFSGTNRYILDYLLEEVLASQPAEIQFFLLFTSILERLSAPLCEAVLNEATPNSSQANPFLGNQLVSPPVRCQSILIDLERANLFLLALDDERRWYRYHHLFADLLRARLDQLYPGAARRLHSRAAAWYEANGFLEEAIQHALAAGDYSSAARLVEAIAENAWLNGHYTRILVWTKAIPAEISLQRPWLCIWNAWAYTQLGILSEIDRWTAAADQAARQPTEDNSSFTVPASSSEAQALALEIAALKAFSVSFSRDYQRAIALAESTLDIPPVSDKKVAQFTRCNILHLLSSMYFATGNLGKAEQTGQEAVELAEAMGFTLRLLHCVNKLVLIHMVMGRLSQADQMIEDTQSFLDQQQDSLHFAVLQLDFRKLELLYERNQVEAFHRGVESVTQKISQVEAPYLLVDCYNIQALDCLMKKAYSQAQEALNQAKAIAQKTYIWEALTWRTERLQVRLWIENGEISQAARWSSQETIDLEDSRPGFPREARATGRARVLLAQGSSREALSLLERLSSAAEKEGRNGSLIEIRTLKALAWLRCGQLNTAIAEMERAIAVAEAEGQVRSIIDEGQPIIALLAQAAAKPSSPKAVYAQHLIHEFQGKLGSLKAMPAPDIPLAERNTSTISVLPISPQAMVEPLSPRELEILQLLAQGKTNQEIASQLVVAAGTIKAHAANIYRKLDVSNRTEAVAQARALRILFD